MYIGIVGTTNTKKEEIETLPERTERTSVLFEGKKQVLEKKMAANENQRKKFFFIFL